MVFDDIFKKEIFRKLIHLSSLWIIFAVWLFDKKDLIIIFSILTLVIFLSELVRKYSVFFEKIYNLLFGSILRSHEKNGSLSGAFYVIFASLLSIIFFEKIIVMTAISIMIISDSFAALVGIKFGRHKILTKSIEGSLAFFISSFLIIIFFYGYKVGFFNIFIVAFISSFVELISKKIRIDDNLSIVISTCLSIKYLL